MNFTVIKRKSTTDVRVPKERHLGGSLPPSLSHAHILFINGVRWENGEGSQLFKPGAAAFLYVNRHFMERLP